MSASQQVITLNDGRSMPRLGLGVYQSTPVETAQAVSTALKNGYRLIDTASAYFNEQEVGEGIRRSGVDRSEIFVTSKLWLTQYGYDEALKGVRLSLRKLGLRYLDLYLLHWPLPSDFERTAEAYKTLQQLQADGLLRSIGVSNFNEQNLDDLFARTEVVPAVNQVELHPFMAQRELRAYHSQHGIVTEAWSPIGGIFSNPGFGGDETKSPLHHPAVRKLEEKYGKSAAQVVLRWHLQNDVVAIPKSTKAERIAENFAIFDFALTGPEMASIDALDTGKRTGPDPQSMKVDTYPLQIPE
jgi:diketogulonate reductase-like aldo/keto reductase